MSIEEVLAFFIPFDFPLGSLLLLFSVLKRNHCQVRKKSQRVFVPVDINVKLLFMIHSSILHAFYLHSCEESDKSLMTLLVLIHPSSLHS